jgi:Cu2+-exporting ATPase
MTPPLAAHPCPHCTTLVEGPVGTFCCHGCEAAHAMLADAGLTRWYDDREQPAPRARTAAGVAWDALPTTTHDDGTRELCLAVDGLRCASCVWVTEHLLQATPGVADATVSFATGRARVRFDPLQIDAASIAERIATLGYRPRPAGEDAEVDRDLLLRLGVAAFGAMNVMGLSAALYVGWFDGMDDRFAQLMRWMALLAATPVATWSAVPFFVGAGNGLRARAMSMDLPIALAVALMWLHGIAATLAHEDGWLDSMCMLVALLLAGRLLEARGRRRTAEAAATLSAVAPREARVVRGDAVVTLPSRDLRPGDRVELGAGDELPADGVVVHGRAQVDQALLTGESAPVPVGVGDAVVAGAIVHDGALQVEVTAAGDDTLVGRLSAGLELAGAAPRTPSPADRAAPAFVVVTLAVAAATAGYHLVQGEADVALYRAVAVLVVACPCAFALAGPMVGAAGLGALARRGVLLRSLDALRALAEVDVVVLDKTGTLTLGRPTVTDATDAALRIAAGLERSSRHPIALAIVAEAVRRGIALPVADDVREVPGEGISGVVDGVAWSIRSAGPGLVRVTDASGAPSLIALADVARPELAADIAWLSASGRRVILLTGDHAAAAAPIARAAGIADVVAGATPEHKVALLDRLIAEGHRPLFVGDGLNDTAALARAHVGLAMADATAPSLLAADGVLVGDRLRPIALALGVATHVRDRIGANLLRSATYNALAVIAAVAGWINPLVAAVLMPLSSGLVLHGAARVEVVARRMSPPSAPPAPAVLLGDTP